MVNHPNRSQTIENRRARLNSLITAPYTLTEETPGRWNYRTAWSSGSGFKSYKEAERVARKSAGFAPDVRSLDGALIAIPTGWFLSELGESVIRTGMFHASLQCRDGGTRATGALMPSAADALWDAIEVVRVSMFSVKTVEKAAR